MNGQRVKSDTIYSLHNIVLQLKVLSIPRTLVNANKGH